MSPRRRTPQILCFSLLAVVAAACGSSSSSNNGNDDLPDGGSGGAFGSGGALGAGGAVFGTGGGFGTGGAVFGSGGAGGALGSGGAGVDGGTGGAVMTDGGPVPDGGAGGPVACEGATVIDPALFDECSLCNGARCVPTAAVPEAQQSLLADCEDGMSKCVPDDLVRYVGQVQLQACRSLANAEGRCLTPCIPEVAAQADRLPKDSCRDGELCAPCYDPTTGEDTGACHVGCDAPTEEPKTFDACCGELGSCVPTSLVPEDQQDLLGKDTCTGSGDLCAPNDLVDPEYKPPQCASISGFEGRCMPACLPDVAADADRLPQDTCEEGYLCAPCFDPVSGDATGACTVNGDAPTQPPAQFAECCGALGVCVPPALVPAAQQSLLDANTCTPGNLCAPKILTDSSSQPEECASISGFEGRCLPACLPDVAADADRLPQSTCDSGYLCAPCYDPTTGDATGACTLNGDTPNNPPNTFDECCGGLGICAPTSLIPANQQSLLAVENCGSGNLCAPKTLTDATAKPPACDSISGFEGRCLPACLPDVAAQADRLPQATCATGELCAPCYDPITGDATGACTINGDAPAEPPAQFDACCGSLGVCVPTALVPSDQQSLLGTDTCTGQGELCAPTLLTDSANRPESCDSISGFEGRCLPECLPDVASQSDRLPQSTCDSGYLCAPCFDPLTGADTGACTVNGDEPAEPPGTFDNCCGGLGACVPTALVPGDQQGLLGTDTCTGQGELCAPTDLADPSFQPETCVVWPSGDGVGPDEDFEGRCLPSCLPDIAAQADRLEQGSCAGGHLCAPCWDPTTGADTGACRLNGDAPSSTAAESTFDACCQVTGGALRGLCVPDALIPAANMSQVPVDTCGSGHHCVPDAKVADPDAPFPSCSVGSKCVDDGNPIIGSGQFVTGTTSGACMPECLLQSVNADGPVPDVGANGQRNCQQGEVCVACTVSQCAFDGCIGCIVGNCNTGACGGAGTCPF